MSGENTLATLNANFKYIQEALENLLPENRVLLDLVPEITDAEKEGRKYLQPVQLTHENGYTYGDGTVFALNEASNAVYGEIQLDANPAVLQTKISESVANRMANSKKAMISEGSIRAVAMKNGAERRLEISMLYGQSGLGTSASSANIDTTHTKVTFTAASWSPGIWAGAVNALLYWYNGASLISSAADSIFTATAVDVDNLAVTVSGTTVGIAALDTAAASNPLKAFFYGSKANDMFGLDLQVTGGASFYGIDPTVYPLWQGNSQDCLNTNFNMAKCLAGLAKAMGKGGLSGRVAVMVSSKTWNNLNADQAALREYDGDKTKEAENGFEGIRYKYGTGYAEIMINNIVKEGEAFAFPVDHLKRIGAKDLDFNRPGKKDEFFQEIPGFAGYAMRCGSEFTVLLDAPAKAVKFINIVNS